MPSEERIARWLSAAAAVGKEHPMLVMCVLSTLTAAAYFVFILLPRREFEAQRKATERYLLQMLPQTQRRAFQSLSRAASIFEARFPGASDVGVALIAGAVLFDVGKEVYAHFADAGEATRGRKPQRQIDCEQQRRQRMEDEAAEQREREAAEAARAAAAAKAAEDDRERRRRLAAAAAATAAAEAEGQRRKQEQSEQQLKQQQLVQQKQRRQRKKQREKQQEGNPNTRRLPTPRPPVSEPGRWVPTTDFTGHKSFGWYHCAHCGKHWVSAHAFPDKWQQCNFKACDTKACPELMWLNDAPYERRRRDSNGEGSVQDPLDKPHDQGRCQVCQERGEPCWWTHVND